MTSPLATAHQTATGLFFDLANPDPSQVRLVDIAIHLSGTERFNAALEYPVSVARHSLNVAAILQHRGASYLTQYAGLMHDAHETYCGDVLRPMKIILGDAWQQLEARVERAVLAAFNIPTVESPGTVPLEFVRNIWARVKEADNLALCMEARACYRGGDADSWAGRYLDGDAQPSASSSYPPLSADALHTHSHREDMLDFRRAYCRLARLAAPAIFGKEERGQFWSDRREDAGCDKILSDWRGRDGFSGGCVAGEPEHPDTPPPPSIDLVHGGYEPKVTRRAQARSTIRAAFPPRPRQHDRQRLG